MSLCRAPERQAGSKRTKGLYCATKNCSKNSPYAYQIFFIDIMPGAIFRLSRPLCYSRIVPMLVKSPPHGWHLWTVISGSVYAMQAASRFLNPTERQQTLNDMKRVIRRVDPSGGI